MSAIQWIAFEGHRCIAMGSPQDVSEKLHARLKASPSALPLVFDACTSERIERVWQSPLSDLLAQAPAPALQTSNDDPPRGRGRPKLGVVAREVTLLPRHWEWLSRQSGGASVALRKLVQAAMKAAAPADAANARIQAAYAFMTVMAADQAHFEEASRALFSDDRNTLAVLTEDWPKDVRGHLLRLTSPEQSVDEGGGHGM